jgi:hypothetical protein
MTLLTQLALKPSMCYLPGCISSFWARNLSKSTLKAATNKDKLVFGSWGFLCQSLLRLGIGQFARGTWEIKKGEHPEQVET